MRPMDPALVRELEASGKRWGLEPRSRHQLLLVEGHVVLALPRTRHDNTRQARNALAALRRHLRGLASTAQHQEY